MTYSEWRQDNEKKYAELVDDGRLVEFPAFDPKTRTEEIYDEAARVTDELIDDNLMTPIHFGCVFAEYLFEKYKIDPLDAEIMGLYFSKGMVAFSANMTARAVNDLFTRKNKDD